MVSREKSTLPGRDYHAAEVFDLERERIFARNWFYAGRAEGLDEPGDFVAVDVAGESVIVVRTKDGDLRGFYNVCRHRGSRLCDEESGRMKGAVKCPYHAWAYSFDGRLIGTPERRQGRDRPRRARPLAGVRRVWQGFLFVHLDADPVPLEDRFADQHDSPLSFARFNLDDLRIGHRTVVEVAANWKILIENYNECLHCPTVHPGAGRRHPRLPPRLRCTTRAAPRAAWRSSTAATASPRTGRSHLPVLPGLTRRRRDVALRVCGVPQHVHRRDRHGSHLDRAAPPRRRPHDRYRGVPLPARGDRRPRLRP